MIITVWFSRATLFSRSMTFLPRVVSRVAVGSSARISLVGYNESKRLTDNQNAAVCMTAHFFSDRTKELGPDSGKTSMTQHN